MTGKVAHLFSVDRFGFAASNRVKERGNLACLEKVGISKWLAVYANKALSFRSHRWSRPFA